MAYYSTIADVQMRGLDDPAITDTMIENSLNLAKEIIDNWCCQDFLDHDEDEIIIDGNDGSSIIVGKRIRKIISLEVSEQEIPTDSINLLSGSPAGEISLSHGYFFRFGNQNVKLTADTGFDSVPYPVEEAASHLASMIINRQMLAGTPELPELESETLDDYSRTRFDTQDSRGVIEQDMYLLTLLRPYKLKGVTV